MKKIFGMWIIVVLSIVLLAGCNKKKAQQVSDDVVDILNDDVNSETNSDQNPLSRYDIEAATVIYEYSGMQNGTETFSFDQFGMREHKSTSLSMNIGGFSQSTNTVSMFLGGDIINFDVETRQGTRIKQPSFLDGLKDEAVAKNQNLREMGEDMLEGMGGVQEGTREVIGKTCDYRVLDQIGTTACIRNGVMLESTVDFMGQSQSIRATSLEEGPISDQLFVIPEDIDFSASASAQEVMNQFFEQ